MYDQGQLKPRFKPTMHFLQQSLALFLLVDLGCAIPELEASDRILNGLRADIISYPYQVGLEALRRRNGKLYENFFNCGGSIISNEFIITAAHCVGQRDVSYDGPVRAADLVVIANSSVLHKANLEANRGSQLASVKNIFIHPRADIAPRPVGHFDCTDNDVAILKLTKPLTLGPGIQAIPLAKANTKLRAKTKAKISGYGYTNVYHKRSNPAGQLYAAEVEIMADDACKKCYANLPSKNIICAGKVELTPGTLDGDSGGPLVVNGVLEGVISCGLGNRSCPDAYIPIANNDIRTFIQKVTGI